MRRTRSSYGIISGHASERDSSAAFASELRISKPSLVTVSSPIRASATASAAVPALTGKPAAMIAACRPDPNAHCCRPPSRPPPSASSRRGQGRFQEGSARRPSWPQVAIFFRQETARGILQGPGLQCTPVFPNPGAVMSSSIAPDTDSCRIGAMRASALPSRAAVLAWFGNQGAALGVVAVDRVRRGKMADDHTKGAGREVKGGVKEAAGKLTGDRHTETEGKLDKAKGRAQRTLGDVKDVLRGDDDHR